MILGLVGSGMIIGLAGAIMALLGGHPFAAVLLVYAVLGSFGTLLMAVMGGMRADRMNLPRH